MTLPDTSTHSYTYDYRVRRISRTEPSGTTAVSYSGGLSAAEYTVASASAAISNPASSVVEYQRGPDMGGGVGGLLYSLRSGTAKFNLSNGRGDVVAQSDDTGALTWTASYEAYGKRPVETGANADRQRANTKEEDPTGLLNEGFRYRDLETGVWLSRDPAGFVDGPNLYAYVRQNPWTYYDPEGLNLLGDWAKTVSSWAKSAADSIEESAPPVFGGAAMFLRIPQTVTGALGDLINGDVEGSAKTASDGADDYLNSTGFKQALTEPWKATPTGSIALPDSLADLVESSNADGAEFDRDAANGMHGWHAQTNATLSNKLGIGASGAIIIGGIIHEIDPHAAGAEIRAQGLGNALFDAGGDIVSNIGGVIIGLGVPRDKFEPEMGRSWGNLVPGPRDPDPNATDTRSTESHEK